MTMNLAEEDSSKHPNPKSALDSKEIGLRINQRLRSIDLEAPLKEESSDQTSEKSSSCN